MRLEGIEPPLAVYKTAALPLSYRRATVCAGLLRPDKSGLAMTDKNKFQAFVFLPTILSNASRSMVSFSMRVNAYVPAEVQEPHVGGQIVLDPTGTVKSILKIFG